MARVISLHEYELRDSIKDDDFLAAVRQALAEGLFELPGLTQVEFGRGLKGARAERWCGLWVYESVQAWERLWGTAENPVLPSEYPPAWRRWELELLGPLLSGPPDEISYTSYEIVISSRSDGARSGSG